MPRAKRKTKEKSRKITQDEFFAILRENGGLYSRTARAIEKQFGVSYTRQAVKQRAQRKPEVLQDIIEQNVDVAEEGLLTLMRTARNENTRFNAIKLYLSTIGRSRGYGDKLELSGPNGGPIKSETEFTGFGFLPSLPEKEDEQTDTNE